jgi:hypothetical protein
MYEVAKVVFYKEQRNNKGKVESSDNNVVSELEAPSFKDINDSIESLVSQLLTLHEVSASDVVLGKVSAKVIDSSVVIKNFEGASGKPANSKEYTAFNAGKGDLFLGCYKYDIQKVERVAVSMGDLFTSLD